MTRITTWCNSEYEYKKVKNRRRERNWRLESGQVAVLHSTALHCTPSIHCSSVAPLPLSSSFFFATTLRWIKRDQLEKARRVERRREEKRGSLVGGREREVRRKTEGRRRRRWEGSGRMDGFSLSHYHFNIEERKKERLSVGDKCEELWEMDYNEYHMM